MPNIFLKACPQCAGVSAVGATRCACGYVFEMPNDDRCPVTMEKLAEEQKLYAEYLGARAEQAAEAARVAAHTAAMDPGNERKASQAATFKRGADAAKAELAAQVARNAQFSELARRAATSRGHRRSRKPATNQG